MNERLIHLRIKIKSLAAEATIIRNEARKVKGMVKWGLNNHRTETLRNYARHNLLAYGLLKKIPYSTIEQKCEKVPNFKMILEIAKRFGASDADAIAWLSEAKIYLKSQGHPEYLFSSFGIVGL